MFKTTLVAMGAALAVFAIPAANAADGDVKQDTQEIHADKKDIVKDTRDIRQDKRETRKDIRERNQDKRAQPLHREQETEESPAQVARQRPRQRQAHQESHPVQADRAGISLFHGGSVGSPGMPVKADFNLMIGSRPGKW